MIFHPTQQDRANLFIKSILDKGRSVKIEPVTQTKTLSQNSYAWLCFTHIAEQMGTHNTKDDVYYHFLTKFPKFKEIEWNGETELVQITLSEFTKEQTKVFIDEFTTDARQEGYDVPDPEEKRIAEMFDYYKQKGKI